MKTFLILGISLPLAFAGLDLRHQPFGSLIKRQNTIQYSLPCTGPGSTCQSQCGLNHLVCDASKRLCFNNDIYNCCPGGYVCGKDEYCAGDGNCCPEGTSLSECGYSTSVATEPGIADATEAPSSATPYEVPPATTTPAAVYSSVTTESPADYASPAPVTPSPYTSISGAPSPSGHPTSPEYDTSTSATTLSPDSSHSGANVTTPSWYPPPQQTANAGLKTEASRWAMGGFAFLGLSFFL